MIALLAATLAAPPAAAEHYRNTVELTATDAIGAALAFSAHTFRDGAGEALLGRDDVFADSLASGALQNGRPLLLTRRDALDPRTDAELERLGVTTVHVLGGEAAISAQVVETLETAGYTVQRHGGATRIETAAAVATAAAAGSGSAILARAFAGEGGDATQAFADSLAAGAWAAASRYPVLLTETAKLSDATAKHLETAEVGRLFVVGGSAAIADAVLAQVEALGIAAERVAGATRFDTAIAVAAKRGVADASRARAIVLAEGQAATAWPSGFAAAAFAAARRAPVVLSNGGELPEATATFLEAGDDTVPLLCAPSAGEDACAAAAEALGQRLAPQVTLAATTVRRYEKVAGTVGPMEDVQALRVDGCGHDDAIVAIDLEGAFELRVTTPVGECEAVFTVELVEGGETTKTHTITVTTPVPATAAPELVSVEPVTVGAGQVTLRFVFDEPVSATAYTRPTGTKKPTAEAFLLHSPLGDHDDGSGNFISEPAEGLENTARRDPENSSAVLVDFTRKAYDTATRAAVANDGTVYAAEDVAVPNALHNAPGSVPLKALTLPAGKIRGANLAAVSNVTTAGAPAGKLRAIFSFDKALNQPQAGDYVLVLADGRELPGEGDVARVGTNHTVTFDPTATRTPEGTVCTEGTCPSAQAAVTSVRRGFLAGTFADRPLQGVAVIAGGVTTRADLTGVTLDAAAHQADFTFDQAVDVAGLEASRFRLYDVAGGSVAAETVVREDETVVRATFAEDAVNKAIVGGVVESDAVKSAGEGNAAHSVGIAQSFAAGEILGPSIASTSVFLKETDTQSGEVTSATWTVTLRFDRQFASPPSSARVYASNGVDVDATCTVPADQPAESPDTDRVVECTATFTKDDVNDPTQQPTLVTLAGDAVQGKTTILGRPMSSTEESARL